MCLIVASRAFIGSLAPLLIVAFVCADQPSSVATLVFSESHKTSSHNKYLKDVAWIDATRVVFGGMHDHSSKASVPLTIARSFAGTRFSGFICATNLSKGTTEFETAGLPGVVDDIAISPDGNTIALCCRGSSNIPLFDVNTRTITRQLEGHQGGVTSLTFLPDGNTIVSVASTLHNSGVKGSELRIWNLKTGVGTQRWRRDDAFVSTVCVSNDGRYYAFGGAMHDSTQNEKGFVEIWSIKSITLEETIYYASRVDTIAFTARGTKILAGCSGWGYKPPTRFDATLNFYEIPTKKLTSINIADWWRPRRQTVRFGKIGISPDDKYLAVPLGCWKLGGTWGELRVWNIDKNAIEEAIPFSAQSHDPVTAASFSSDGRTLLATSERELLNWEITKKPSDVTVTDAVQKKSGKP